MIESLIAARWWWSPLAAVWVVIAAGISAALPDRPPVYESPDHAVVVDVVDLAHRSHNGVAVVGCGEVVASERLDRHTWRFLLEQVEDDCALRAVRWDGLMPATSASMVIPAGATRTDVTLTLPRWRAGGLGVTLRFAGGAVFVSDVVGGMGADFAGVRPGDVIVAVDGVRVQTTDIEEFRTLVAGPVNEHVELTLADSRGVTRKVGVRRSYLDGER